MSDNANQEISQLPKEFDALYHNGEPVIPSITDALSLLGIEKNLNIKELVKSQYAGITKTAKDLKVEINTKKSLSFLIPLTAYIPLPTPYHATLITRDTDSNEGIDFTCVTLDNYNPRIKLDDNEVLLQLSYALVTVSSEQFNNASNKLEEFPRLRKVYDVALVALNSVINSYKATPWRHSHILQAQSALGAPGSVYIALTEFPSAKILEKDMCNLHDHLIGELLQSRMMNENELSNFRTIHVADSNGNSFPLWLVSKLNEAIDARCNGKDDSAVLLADSYVELTIRYLLYNVLVAKGLDHMGARARARNHRKFDDLLKDLAIELCKSPSDFKSTIKYGPWDQSCRKKRNALNHEIERVKITSNESFKAVHNSAILVSKICEIINAQYPGAITDTQWLMSATWMTESMLQAKRQKAKPKASK